jgi:hypothetical protein
MDSYHASAARLVWSSLVPPEWRSLRDIGDAHDMWQQLHRHRPGFDATTDAVYVFFIDSVEANAVVAGRVCTRWVLPACVWSCSVALAADAVLVGSHCLLQT